MESNHLGSAPRVGPRRARADEGGRRVQIIDAASRVLGRRGYTETSLKEIAREAGVAPGLLHYYFESKEDLLVEVALALGQQMAADWKLAVDGVDDPLERIVAALDAAADRCARRPELWHVLFDLALLGLSNPAVRLRTQEVWKAALVDVEAEARKVLGMLPAYSLVPPRDLAETVNAAVDGIALTALVQGRDPARLFRALKVMLLSLVVTAYVTAGRQPPVARLQQILERSEHAGEGDATGTGGAAGADDQGVPAAL